MAAFFGVPGRAHTYFGGESPLWARLREPLAQTARVSVVRLNLKEAVGKTLARRTEIAYEAVMLDEKANIFKVQ